MQNRLFVAYKPKGITSNHFLSKIKRKYNVKKAGFSGTLDPFACGVLIIAFNQYTKLFRFLKKSPKKYRATLWIGAKSESLDVDNISEVKQVKSFHEDEIKAIFSSVQGDIEFVPPKYCAKKVKGKRAYELARNKEDFVLKKEIMHVFYIKLISYMHPFLTLEVSLSEGGYVRSLGEIIAKKMGYYGSLTFLERISEGEFKYENEKALKAVEFLNMQQNFYEADEMDVKLGKKLDLLKFKKKEDGFYFLEFDEEFAIISIKENNVEYALNKVKLC